MSAMLDDSLDKKDRGEIDMDFNVVNHSIDIANNSRIDPSKENSMAFLMSTEFAGLNETSKDSIKI